MAIDPRAASGFGGAAEAYERARPDYPDDIVAELARELGIAESSTVVDLAAGTGKLTRALIPLAGRVIAVEPSDEMRAVLQRLLPEVDARRGSAEAIPLDDEAVDAVFVGEAFHWFQAEEACREIARVLVPGGRLALIWRQARWEEAELPWLSEFGRLVEPHRRAAGAYPSGEGEWQAVLDGRGPFESLQKRERDHVVTASEDDFVALVSSWSWIANLPERERLALLADVRRLVAGAGSIPLHFRAEVFWTRKRSP